MKKGPLPLKEALNIGMEVSEALEAAHRVGIIHRDLKPANIMLTKSAAIIGHQDNERTKSQAAPDQR